MSDITTVQSAEVRYAALKRIADRTFARLAKLEHANQTLRLAALDVLKVYGSSPLFERLRSAVFPEGL